jgi:SAM-dependent methyltransferase
MLKERDTPGGLLEIGARARSGVVRREVTPKGWTYTGLDIVPGENVDVVGDAHELSSIFPMSSFDAVMAFAVLEHVLMPWKLVLELNHVLKPGAVGLFVTHQAWPVHEEPWDFWRYSSWAWHALLNPHTGFEILETRMAEPASLVARVVHVGVNHGDVPCYQSSSVLFRKVSGTALQWPVRVSDVTGTFYPE